MPEDKRDPEKHTKLLNAEGPAILGWSVLGARDVLQNGLTEPESVKKATDDYQTNEDSLALFISESCARSPLNNATPPGSANATRNTAQRTGLNR